MLTLKIEERTTLGKATKRLPKDMMPAVFYGHKEESTPISISKRAFQKVWKEAGESTIISLAGLGEEKEALIQEVDFDPVRDEPRHADFYVIEKGKTLTVPVPIVFEGVSPAVKDLGGILVKVMHELEIEALPKDLPHSIVADISKLSELNSKLHVSDLALPSGVTAKASGEDVVALIDEYVEEKEEAPAMSLADIEVVERGKKEEEEVPGEEKESTS